MSEPNKLSGNSCLSCDEARVFLPLAVEDELDSVRTNLLFAHLDDCGECETAYAELADERHWIAENLVKAPALPAGFAAKVCDRIIEEGLVGEAPAETADSEAGQAAEIVVSSTSWRDFLPWATAAAMALFFVLIAGLTRDRAELPLDPAEVAGGSAPSALDVDTVSSKKSAGAHLVSLVKSSSPITESCEDLDTAPLAKDGSFADERVIRSSEFCSLDSGTPKSAFQGSSFAAKEQCTEIDPIFLASDEPEPGGGGRPPAPAHNPRARARARDRCRRAGRAPLGGPQELRRRLRADLASRGIGRRRRVARR